jgi:hypothetical protein
VARARSKSNKASQSVNTDQSQKEIQMADKGTLTSLKMIPVSDEELDSARGGRGHGEYDNFLDAFLAADIRGTEVGFEGVKSNSIKTGLKSAIERAVKAEKVAEGTLQVRGKDEKVYLVRVAAGEESE